MDDGQDVQRLRHWQVKDFPEAKRKAVTLAAQAAELTVAQWLEPIIDQALAGEGGVTRVTPPANHHANGSAGASPQGLRELAEAYAALKRAEAPSPLLARLEALIREQIRAQRAPTAPRTAPKALPAPGLPPEQAG
jgi:hypothetical protein